VSPSVIAIDLGGTVVKLGLVRDGAIVARRTLDAYSERGLAQVLPRLAAAIRELRMDDISGIGLAIPTLVDARRNRVLAPMLGKYDGINHFDFVAWCAGEFAMPIKLENDAHAALLGEWRFGAARGCTDAVVVTLGTGIGTSVLFGGRPLRGTHSQTGNLGGHFVIDPHGFDCVCGARGCLEAQQHLNAVRSIARSDARFASSLLAQPGDFTYADLFDLRGKDPLARDLVQRSLDLWGALVVSLSHAYDPERIIIGGGVMRSGNVIVPHLQSFADRACTPWGKVRIVPAQLADDAALLGVASLFSQPPEYL
jgi:glucokinase